MHKGFWDIIAKSAVVVVFDWINVLPYIWMTDMGLSYVYSCHSRLNLSEGS